MSPDIFHKTMDQTYEKCKGAVGIADDIHVFGNDNTCDLHLHEGNVYSYTSRVKFIVNSWHGLQYVKVEDMHSDMARNHKQQYRQKLQAPTPALGVTPSINKRSTVESLYKMNSH